LTAINYGCYTGAPIHVHNLGKRPCISEYSALLLKKNVKAYINPKLVSYSGQKWTTLVSSAFVFFDCLLHRCPAYKEENKRINICCLKNIST